MERRPLLEAWLGLQECLYAELADGTRSHAEDDPTQVGRGRLSAAQYLKFTLPEAPGRLGSDFAALELSVDLDKAQLPPGQRTWQPPSTRARTPPCSE